MSNSDVVVKAEGLSKIYRLGIKEQVSDSLAGSVFGFLRSPVKNFRKYRSLYRFDDVTEKNGSNSDSIIWAVRDVSFDIRQGEVVGIIGRNGAGKSTLLKILTRITPPTRGRAEIHGRVSSLLEVGTGFHHELTGRENIFLNGTILGMTKSEVDRKFDEIVAFSGVERFLDTPVKRYSSGMSVRLAFAVAAHLEPEILIVDEVLAVGDADFQKKCINKMQDVSRHGRTVLFVSHNMPAVAALCSRAILLSGGTVAMDGPTHDVIGGYLNSEAGAPPAREWLDAGSAPAGEIARLVSVRTVDQNNNTAASIDIRDPVGIEMVFDVLQPGHRLLPHYWFYNDEGTVVFTSLEQNPDWWQRSYPVGRYSTTAWIPGNFLSAGRLFVTASLITRHPDVLQFDEQQVISVNVRDNMGIGTARGEWAGELPGAVRPLFKWSTKQVAAPIPDESARQRSL
jgi:lipopolysaccharide transport system ATP-binding protein